MSVQERYDHLREEVLSALRPDLDDSALIELKNNYADEINSKRKLSCVNDITGLINLLETRDILNYNNIEPYYYIAKRILNDSSLASVLNDYENWLQTAKLPQLSNVYLNDHGEYTVLNEYHQGNGYIEHNAFINEDTLSNSSHSINDLPEANVVSTQMSECQSLIISTQNNEDSRYTVWQQLYTYTLIMPKIYIVFLLIICVIMMTWVQINLIAKTPRIPQPNTTNHSFDQIHTGHSSTRNPNSPLTEQQFSGNRTTYPITSRNNQLDEQVGPIVQNANCTMGNRDARMRQAVLHSVSERLGRSWRDVARFLNVREYQIDEIQNQHPNNLKEQSYQALHLSLSQYSLDKWKINLMRALEKGRRKDLKELVEELILSNECNIGN